MDSELFTGYPTHIEKAGGLLKISLQKDHQLGVFVERYLHENVKDLEGSRYAPQRQDLAPGVIGIGRYDDQQYYRIKVLELLPQDDLVSVLFIDFGNIAPISVSDIRLLNYEVHKALLNIPGLAINCYLERVCVSKPWTEAELGTLKKLVLYEEWQCAIRHLAGRIKVVNILFHQSHKKLTEMILENDLGTPLSDAELIDAVKRMSTNRLNYEERMLGQSLSQRIPNRMTNLNDNYLSDRVQPSIHPSYNSPSAHMLSIGSSHNAYVSHMKDGPYSFSIQLKVNYTF